MANRNFYRQQLKQRQLPLESTAEDDRLMALISTNIDKQTPAGANMMEVARTMSTPSPFDLLAQSSSIGETKQAPSQMMDRSPGMTDVTPIMSLAGAQRKRRNNSIFDQLVGAQSKALESQRKGVGTLENMIREYQDKIKAEGKRVDLTPFLALTDFVSGGKSAQNYKAPKDRSGDILAMERALQKERGALTNQEIDLLKTRLSAQLAREKAAKDSSGKMLTASTGDQLADLKTQMDTIGGIYNDWKTRVKDPRDGSGQTSKLGSYFSGWVPGSSEAEYDDLRKQRAQLIGKALEGGKLTDVDYEKYMQFLPTLTDTEAQAQRKLNNLSETLSKKHNDAMQTFNALGFTTGTLSPLKPKKVGERGSSEGDTKTYNGITYKRVGDEWVAQ